MDVKTMKKKLTGLQDKSSNAAKPKDKRPWLAQFRFKPGKSGNPQGKRSGCVSIAAALKNALAKGTTADDIAREIIDGVIVRKDAAFARILLDRTEGPVAQALNAHLSGSIVGPVVAPAQVQIIIPSNGREGLPVIDAPAALPETGKLRPPPSQALVSFPPKAPEPKPAPAPVQTVAAPQPETKPLRPEEDPGSVHYKPACFRRGWLGGNTL